jgi:putative ABC transport system ATP-binding protein
MDCPTIECISLCKYYSDRNHITKAVDNINLQIDNNEFVLIKGRSGAGKSTLLNLTCGLDRPTQGSVLIEKQNVDKLSNLALSKLLLKKIGIIFQNFNLLPTYTVYENIEIALQPFANDREQIKGKIVPLLEQLELADKINSLPSELSVGQQQKVAIARTLAKQPFVIFADEPTGSVDDETAKEIIKYLLFLKSEKNADRIMLMQNGKINS